ncbi:MaoC family dehydratase [Cellulosimicrobium cellulans]|uniref:MaoC family dehydratase n=1 Tax=Cellulosimicrobium cellulans TaxID=1710 RepID=UPI001965B459|nr:MaoC family dehydratase [Cellulosimicrobium cellulans]MBN0038955.1 MaoC family dehydratase [Cellulosimicrobium cellulans]
MREVVQRGLYYDELETGVVYRHRPGRTLTEADDVVFSTLTMNHQALHLDAAWAATQPFGQRLVNSMMTLSTLVGLSVGQVTQGTIVANLGFREVEFPKPLFHGDTLYAETEVVEKRLSASRPGQGVVTLEHRGLNQDGVLVARAVRTALFWTRAAHEAAPPRVGAHAPDAPAEPGSVVTEAAEPGDIPGFGAGRDDRPGLGDEESAW